MGPILKWCVLQEETDDGEHEYNRLLVVRGRCDTSVGPHVRC